MGALQPIMHEMITVIIYFAIIIVGFMIIKKIYDLVSNDYSQKPLAQKEAATKAYRKAETDTHRKATAEKTFNFDKRLDFILSYDFPTVVTNRFVTYHPTEDLDAAKTALKLFFVTALYNQERTGRMDVEMTDEVADHLWHIFLLDTRAYAEFCEQAFGTMLHHIPYEEQKTLEGHQAKSEQAIKDMYSFLRSYHPRSHTRLASYINEQHNAYSSRNRIVGGNDDSICCGMGAFELWFWWMILSDNSSAAVSPASATGVWCTGQSITESSPCLTTDAWSKESETTEIGHSVSSSIAHSVCGSSCRSASDYNITTSSCSSSSSCGGSSSSCGGGGGD